MDVETSEEEPDQGVDPEEKEEILGNRSAEVDPLSSIVNEENEPMMPPDRLRRDSKM